MKKLVRQTYFKLTKRATLLSTTVSSVPEISVYITYTIKKITQNPVFDVILVSLLLTLNIFHTLFLPSTLSRQMPAGLPTKLH